MEVAICGGDTVCPVFVHFPSCMRKYLICLVFLSLSCVSLKAQIWTAEDSLHLQNLLRSVEEIELNKQALEELKRSNSLLGNPEMDVSKPWLQFDESLPNEPQEYERKQKGILTLHPYKSDTPYNWDPIYQRKIKVDKNTWRGDPFYELKRLRVYSNWASSPLDLGPRESVEQIEATGLRYRVTERANNAPVGAWQNASGGNGQGGLDLMTPFTKEFWNRKAVKRRARTLEVLQAYGDSLTAILP